MVVDTFGIPVDLTNTPLKLLTFRLPSLPIND